MPSSSSTPALDSGLRSDQFKEIPESEVKINANLHDKNDEKTGIKPSLKQRKFVHLY